MKNEVYQSIRELVTQYGKIDDLWWDGAWLGQQGTDRETVFFWEPGKFRATDNEWKVDDDYSETDSATGRPLGLSGVVREHQPDIVVNTRSGWIGDYENDEGSSVPTGEIQAGKLIEKCFTVNGDWGYTDAPVMAFGEAMDILVNAWVRDMTFLVNVGPDRTGKVSADQAGLVRKIGAFMDTCGAAVYGTRGGPWQPKDGEYGFTSKDKTFYVHLLPGYSGNSFTTPSIGDAKVTRVFDVAADSDLSYEVDGDGKVTINGLDRNRTPEDTVVGVSLDRSVQPADIAVGKTATASTEDGDDTAAKAVDGSTATRWSADHGNADHWLTVDLRSAEPLHGTRIAWDKGGVNYRYRIEGSTNNSDWTTLTDQTSTDSTAQLQTTEFSAEARYVRVTVTGLPSDARASIRSFEVYNRPIALPA